MEGRFLKDQLQKLRLKKSAKPSPILRRPVDSLSRQAVIFIKNIWRNHPLRKPIIITTAIITAAASFGALYNPSERSPIEPPETAFAGTYQFTPTAGNLVVGTAQQANSLLAGATEGVNTGSWRGTLADDNFHWQVTALDTGTPNLDMQLTLGNAQLANTNKLIIQTEIDLDIATRLLQVQICDWVSSTAVDHPADAQCSFGGWRTLNSRNAAGAIINLGMTAPAAFQWHIYDGYFATGGTGGVYVPTPLTNFTANDTQPLLIRYWSDSDITGSGSVAVDFLRAIAFVDSVYLPAGIVNNNTAGGALTGNYQNAVIVGNTATAQQVVATGDTIRVQGAGTATSIADFSLIFRNVQTYTGANTFYFHADYSCSATGPSHRFDIFRFDGTPGWVDINPTAIACATGDVAHGWALNNVNVSDFIDEANGHQVRIRMYGTTNSTVALRLDFAYLMLGTTNTDTAECEITWGTGVTTDCVNTRNIVGQAAASVWSNPAEDESNTKGNNYYAFDCDQDATVEECSAANIGFSVRAPNNAQIAVNHFAARFAGDMVGTVTPHLTAQLGIRDFSGTQTSTAALGGWTAIGPTSATSALIYTNSITAMTISVYGNMANPEDHVDTSEGKMNLRLRTTASGVTTDNSRWDWDFAMVSIGWVVDPARPSRNHKFAPTSDTLAVGTQTARLGATAAANTGVNTGSWMGTLTDDNQHWTIAGANVVGVNYDAQLNFATARLNGANRLIVQTEYDTDANISLVLQICDWVSNTSVDHAADANCTGGGWRTLNSRNASNVPIAYTATVAVTMQWHLYDGYFSTGTAGGVTVSTPLANFFHATNGVKIRYFSTTQSSTNLDIDFLRLNTIVDSTHHPAGFVNLAAGGVATGSYVNAQVIGNTATAQQAIPSGDAIRFAARGTATVPAEYYFVINNVRTYTGMNAIYVKADYSCSATGISHTPRVFNFTTATWVNLTAPIACVTGESAHAWALNNININDFIRNGEMRVGQIASAASGTIFLQIDLLYVILGSVNDNNAECQISFGTGVATDCINTRDLNGTGTANHFTNPAEDESATMGLTEADSYYAFDNETTPDTTVEEATSSNISFPVTLPSNANIAGLNFAGRLAGCGVVGAACGAAVLSAQMGFQDYSGFNQVTGGWAQFGGSIGGSLAYTDSVMSLAINAYGFQMNPKDFVNTTNNRVNVRLRPTIPGTAAANVTTAWDFVMVSIQWTELGIDISGTAVNSSDVISVAVDNVHQVGFTAITSAVPVTWTISNVLVNPGQTVTVWISAVDGGGLVPISNRATALTRYDGSGDITGMVLTPRHLTLGSHDNQVISNFHIGLFDNSVSGTANIFFDVSAANDLTVDQNNTYTDERLVVLSGTTYQPGSGGGADLTTVHLDNNGTITADSNSFFINGSWQNNGVFNAGTSTVTFNSAVTGRTLGGAMIGASSFHNLTFNGVGGAWSLNAAIEMSNLSMIAGSLLGTQNVTASGDVTGTAGIINLTGGIFEQRADTNQIFGTTSGSTAWIFNDLTFSNSHASAPITITTQTGGTGVLTIAGVLRIGRSGDAAVTTLNAGNRIWNLGGSNGDPFQILASPAGSLIEASSTFAYTGNNAAGNTVVQAETYNHLTLNNAAETFVLENTTTTVGNLTITAGTLDVTTNNFVLNINGNWSNSGIFTARGGTVTLGGTATQTLSGTMTGTSSFNNLTIANSSGASATDNERTGFVPSVDFNAAATVTGTYTITTANVRVEYNSGSTYTFNNINWNGQNAATRIFFRNSDTTGAWFLNVSGTQTNVSHVNVSRSNASPGNQINASNGTNHDGTNNINWLFAVVGNPPNSPTALTQIRVTAGTAIAVGGWTNETQLRFEASVSDPDPSDTLRLCVEVDVLATSFSNVDDLCGTAVNYTGTAVIASVTLTGLAANSQFHWQARVRDTANTTSAWVSFGANPANERDFGVDTTAPTITGTVRDGLSTDATHNDGSLTALSANWATAFNTDISGLNRFEFSIGTTSGGTQIANWSSVGSVTEITVTGLNLRTNQSYFFNLRAIDNAGNTSSVASSNGQEVLPELTFSLSSLTVTFSNLNAANFRTSTQTTTLTTSTNAFGGYVIRAYKGGLLSSGSFTVPDFSAGSYASPASWPIGFCSGTTCGFGYTSSDTNIQGLNRFNNGTLFAPFTTGPFGDIVADHTDNITGLTGEVINQNHTITYRVSVDELQAARNYTGQIFYIVTGTF